MDKKALGKVAKLIPLLASDKEGEVLGAVAAIRRVLAAGGMDLHDIAKLVLGTPVTVNIYGSGAAEYPGKRSQTDPLWPNWQDFNNADFGNAFRKAKAKYDSDSKQSSSAPEDPPRRRKRYEGYKEPESDTPNRSKHRSALDPDDLEKVNYCLEAIDILANGEYEFLKGLQIQDFPITVAQDAWLYSIHRRVKRTRDNRAASESPKKPFSYKERHASRKG